MLLTITYEGKNTQNLGYLLHKNPERAQEFTLSYGKAYVFYPEVSDERTTAALLLDIDPLDLARGKVGSMEGGLFDYVNDRPYASTSFMCTAISKVFGTAMNGRCETMQELADTPLKLTAYIGALKDNGKEDLAKDLFEPLGYQVETKRTELDEKFPEWEKSPYIDLTISGTVRLSELLNHIYVLIPVFDRQKHYYTSEAEITKLLKHGEGWLAEHPARELITRRYLDARRSYAGKALEMLLTEESQEESLEESLEESQEDCLEENPGEISERKGEEISEGVRENDQAENQIESGASYTSLNTKRMEAVKNAVLKSGATSVIDLGCGECKLTSLLLREAQIKKITACDVSVRTLEKAAGRLHLERMQPYLKNKLSLIQGSLTYRDSRFEGYDCASVIEVIEHIEPARIQAFERCIFEFAAPGTVVLTTPNREYNVNYEKMKENQLRHGDHRFEWTREEFENWTKGICERFGYSCRIEGIGDVDEKYGTPTQMAVFTRVG